METHTSSLSPRQVIDLHRQPTPGRLVIAGLLLLLALSGYGLPRGQAPADTPASDQRIVTASRVWLRAEPSLAGAAVGKLGVGTRLSVLETTNAAENIDGTRDFWYRVQVPGGLCGWIFGTYTMPFNSAQPGDSLLRLAQQRLAARGLDFLNYQDLCLFLRREASSVKDPSLAAELELHSFRALSKSLKAVPFRQSGRSPYREWLQREASRIIYNEPAGEWIVRSESLWDLQHRYAFLPIAEEIAWEAATNQLPGECEGYLPCYLYWTNSREGRYLGLYPDGGHSGQAIANIYQELCRWIRRMGQPATDCPPVDRWEGNMPISFDSADLPSLSADLASLRTVVMTYSGSLRNEVLQILDHLGEVIGKSMDAQR